MKFLKNYFIHFASQSVPIFLVPPPYNSSPPLREWRSPWVSPCPGTSSLCMIRCVLSQEARQGISVRGTDSTDRQKLLWTPPHTHTHYGCWGPTWKLSHTSVYMCLQLWSSPCMLFGWWLSLSAQGSSLVDFAGPPVEFLSLSGSSIVPPLFHKSLSICFSQLLGGDP